MLKLYKLKKNRKICGVCAGLSDKYKIDATLLRVIAVLLCLFDGVGLIVYLLLAFLLPDKSEIN